MSTMTIADISRIGFLLLQDYSMTALSNAIEPLRLANQASGLTLFSWAMIHADGAPHPASNGLVLSPVHHPEHAPAFDAVFAVGGGDAAAAADAASAAVLVTVRRYAASGAVLGAICTGALALARAGLLDGRRCARLPGDPEVWRHALPSIDFVDQAYVNDRGILTCADGIAPIEMMLDVVRAKAGPGLAAAVADRLGVDRHRQRREAPQPAASPHGSGHDALLRAARIMEDHIEEPIALDAVAGRVGLSLRQLERLFRRHLGTTPAQHYLGLRLRRARDYLLQTDMSVMEVTVACGFQSSSHFCKSYRTLFGHPPSRERYLERQREAA